MNLQLRWDLYKAMHNEGPELEQIMRHESKDRAGAE